MSASKKRDHRLAVTRELRVAGFPWRLEHGGKHLRLVVDVHGREEVVIVSGSPSDYRSQLAARADIRRRIKKWKAEAGASLATEPAPAKPRNKGNEAMEANTEAAVLSSPALTIRKGVVTANSRDVAAQFGKEPKHVHESIKKITAQSPDWCKSNFRPFYINDLTGKSVSHYEMTRDGFSLLAMGFTGNAALQWKIKYIAAFNQMEAEIRPSAASVNVGSLAEEVRSVVGGIVKQVVGKALGDLKAADELLLEMIDEIRAQIVAPAVAPELTLAKDYIPSIEIVRLAGVKSMKRYRGLTTWITGRMLKFCAREGYDVKLAPIHPGEKYIFPRAAAERWLEDGGRQELFRRVDRKWDNKTGQIRLVLP